MIRDNHYYSLKGHITNLISGLSQHQEDLPDEIIDQISEDFYEAALESLEKREEEYHRSA